MNKIIVIKMGGSVADSRDTTIEDIVYLQKKGAQLIIVHGGGNLISEWLKKQGVATRFVRGERVTDKPSLEVATAVLAGLANKEITGAINNSGGKAMGISGVDGALLQAVVKDTELGYVGAINRVDTAPLRHLLKAGYIPVVAPISLNAPAKTPDAPQMLNVNGDTAAGEIAAAIGAQKLVFLTDVAGILDHDGKLLTEISPEDAEALIASGVASGGMIPKIRAGLRSLSGTKVARIIDGREPHALRREMEGQAGGTTISK